MTKQMPCPHDNDCPGCSEDKEAPATLDTLRHFCSSWNLLVPYATGKEMAWRSRAKLAVRATPTGFAIGLFRAHTHDIVDISDCRMHTLALNQAIEKLKMQAKKNPKLSFYNEKNHSGALRYLLLSEETSSSKVSVVFVLNVQEKSKKTNVWIEFAKTLMDVYPTLFHSFWINFQPEKTNTICGKTSQHIIGELWQWEEIGKASLPFHPLHFRQANLPLFRLLIEDLEKQIPEHTTILDLFCGMGAIGFALSHKAKRVDCVEIDPTAQESFDEAKKRLPQHLQNRLSFYCLSCDSRDLEPLLQDAETVIVDPPRKGLSSALIDQLTNSSATTLAYISCCAETLLENLSSLTLKGWKPVFAKTYQFFPGTDHMESLVVLKRDSFI